VRNPEDIVTPGVLTWGRPLLRRVAFDVVSVDRPMATSAQLVQAGVRFSAVAFGFFTSMNQTVVGAIAGAGIARGRHSVHVADLQRRSINAQRSSAAGVRASGAPFSVASSVTGTGWRKLWAAWQARSA
jgi:phosphate/sulfate permease